MTAQALATIGGTRLWYGTPMEEILYGDGFTIAELSALTISEASAYTVNGVADYKPLSYIEPMTIYDVCGYKDNTVLITEDVSIQHQIEERSTARFAVNDPTGAYSFEQGHEVLLDIVGPDIDRERIFGGVVQEAAIDVITASGHLFHHISATDYHYIAESKLFTGAYVTPTAGEIVYDILYDELYEEGVREGAIACLTALEDQTFSYVTCAEALDKVAELAGYTWFISEDKYLYFVERSTYTADWQITTSNDVLWDGLRLTHCNPEYRNVQFISGAKAITALRTEPIKGDGTTKTFVMAFPITKEPTITINSTPLSSSDIGIKGVESSKKWYWSSGDNTIYQDEGETTLQSSDTGTVDYYGSYRIMARVSQAAEVTNWGLKCGYGTGQVERIMADTNAQNKDAALDLAKAKLLHYATLGRKLEYRTRDWGLAAGTLQTVTLPKLGLSAVQFLIAAIDITIDAAGPICSVTAYEGPADQSWERIFCNLAADARASQLDSAGEESTVQGLETFTKTWAAIDQPNPYKAVYPDVLPSDVDFPCLDVDDRFKYVVLYTTGDTEFFRKIVAEVDDVSATEIDVVSVILANEANGTPITAAALWGGNLCTSTAGTGIEMHKENYVKLKNSLESLQLDFVELKNW
jgi:hypothetical protein